MRYAMVGLILFLTTASAWAGTLTDNFDDGGLEGWRRLKAGDQSAQWFVKDGELVCTSKNVCQLASVLVVGDNTWTDYVFECRFKIAQTFPVACNWGSAIGVGVHGDDPTLGHNLLDFFWHAEFDGIWDINRCERSVRGNFDQPAAPKDKVVLEEGKWYSARVVADGKRYKMFLDEKLLCDFQSDLPDSGGALLFARNCEVHFDNVVITGDDIPDKNLGLPVEPKAKLAITWATIKQRR